MQGGAGCQRERDGERENGGSCQSNIDPLLGCGKVEKEKEENLQTQAALRVSIW